MPSVNTEIQVSALEIDREYEREELYIKNVAKLYGSLTKPTQYNHSVSPTRIIYKGSISPNL